MAVWPCGRPPVLSQARVGLCLLCSLQPGLTMNSLSQVDFEDVDVRTPVERRRGEERQRHRDRLYRGRAEQAVREMAGGALGTGGPASQHGPCWPRSPLLRLWWSCRPSGQGEGTCIQLVTRI